MKWLHLLIEWYRQLDNRTRLRWGCTTAGLIAMIFLYSTFNDHIAGMATKRITREADIAEISLLKVRYLQASVDAQKLSNRLASVKGDDSPSKLIEDIGIKGKNSQIRPLKGGEGPTYLEDAAEVKLEGLTANEVVNLLHRLENGRKPVLINKALIRSRFDNPSKLDLTLTIALLKSLHQGHQ